MNLTAEFTQTDENGIVELEAKWEVEYVCHHGILGDHSDPPSPCEFTIISRELTEVRHYYDAVGYELKVTEKNGATWDRIERHLRKWLDEEELIACCERHWESLDDEGRRVA